jgi:UDP-galactopyranose mutase
MLRWRKRFEKGVQKMNAKHRTTGREDLVCFSHLRWGFVFQRPQHLMSRFARRRRVFFIEEPIRESRAVPEMRLQVCEKTGVFVATPLLPAGGSEAGATESQIVAQLIGKLFRDKKIHDHIAWYYTPMALEYTKALKPKLAIYDCMDELSLFQNAPPELRMNEQNLFELCHLVFTGGVSLFEAKRKQHDRVFPFPSSVDCAHFAQARTMQARTMEDTPEDQKHLGRPRLGYAGVIDERIDLALICGVAERKPAWQIIMIGPVVKIDPSTLPRRSNIHWLGMKDYASLPVYLAGWDVALMPFAINDSTRYISPTKTPEYLAAGLPVVSTPVRDVERQYGELGLVHIESDAEGFCVAAERAMTYGMTLKWRERADAYLSTLSWDRTWQEMNDLIDQSLAEHMERKTARPSVMTASQSGAAPF